MIKELNDLIRYRCNRAREAIVKKGKALLIKVKKIEDILSIMKV